MNRIYILFFLVFAVSSVVAGDITKGREKANTCAACHGQTGNSVQPIWPKLAGQHVGYTVKQLQDFRSGARENSQMSPMAQGLSDADIDDLAIYYATQTTVIGNADIKLIDAGEKLYRAGNARKGLPACIGCHGPNGAGNPGASYPRLGGQHAQYTEMQLNAFRDGKRTNKIMRAIAERMNNDDIKAIASYIQGLY